MSTLRIDHGSARDKNKDHPLTSKERMEPAMTETRTKALTNMTRNHPNEGQSTLCLSVSVTTTGAGNFPKTFLS